MRTFSLALAVVLVAGTFAPADAGFLGDTISAVYSFPDTTTPYPQGTFTPNPFVVGAGVDSVLNIENVTFISVDFSDSQLFLDFSTVLNNPSLQPTPFNGPIFTVIAGADEPIIGVTVNGATNLGGFDASRVSFTDNQVALNFSGLSYDSYSQVKLDFTFGSSAVPEPASVAMMGLGLASTGLMARRRLRKV